VVNLRQPRVSLCQLNRVIALLGELANDLIVGLATEVIKRCGVPSPLD